FVFASPPGSGVAPDPIVTGKTVETPSRIRFAPLPARRDLAGSAGSSLPTAVSGLRGVRAGRPVRSVSWRFPALLSLCLCPLRPRDRRNTGPLCPLRGGGRLAFHPGQSSRSVRGPPAQ